MPRSSGLAFGLVLAVRTGESVGLTALEAVARQCPKLRGITSRPGAWSTAGPQVRNVGTTSSVGSNGAALVAQVHRVPVGPGLALAVRPAGSPALKRRVPMTLEGGRPGQCAAFVPAC